MVKRSSSLTKFSASLKRCKTKRLDYFRLSFTSVGQLAFKSLLELDDDQIVAGAYLLMVHVLKVVLNGGHAYEIANKCRVWEHDTGHSDEYVKLLNDPMFAWSSVTISLVHEHYDGFKDAKKLVDGGLGMCMGKIVEKYPHIEGVNFDLPHTSTLLNFSDEDCLKMLANCNKALPRGGKMIVVDLMYSKDGAGPTPTVARPGDLKNTRCCLKKVALATFPS
ncbi:anthranilate N-methyltransferase [Selaginella moellendorffii]|uniref:anthranilate N-methyltransferase n=1 Tax=Selaginella moellendorffii TaxID=88036 RepID=UPI000D1CBF35|nr:anthranilate N-methyltransferase [Selaginella moellendorffii]|eukprot:XP_024532093.1 anthranilate N-methyltransferase [Selaginella moellendorffii]